MRSQPVPSSRPLIERDFRADIAAVQGIAAVPHLLDLICRATGMGFAAIARVTEERWVCCAARDDIGFGLSAGGELAIETTICQEISKSREAVIINDAANDCDYATHQTPIRYGFRSYISMPIVLGDGSFYGTLCAIDKRPAQLQTLETVAMFRLFAQLIAAHLDTTERLAASEATLLTERETSELREQFIAVLGHDLRNPLASIAAGAHLLSKSKTPEASAKILTMMQKSVGRMSALIDNLLDYARGRLGGGLTLVRHCQPMQPILMQVIDELRASYPAHTIDADLTLDAPVDCDPVRVAQLVSNLLGNALAHGAADQPICVRGAASADSFEVSVSNGGPAIPPAALARLFMPYSRGNEQSIKGLGLGLFIASEIARAHGGTLTVASTDAETRFTFRMPV